MNMLLRSHGFEPASSSNADSVFDLLDSFFSLLEDRLAHVSRERDTALTKLQQYENHAHELANKINKAYYRRTMGTDIMKNDDWELQDSFMETDGWVDSCGPLSVPATAFAMLDNSLSNRLSDGPSSESNPKEPRTTRDLRAELVEKIQQMSPSRVAAGQTRDLRDELIHKISQIL